MKLTRRSVLGGCAGAIAGSSLAGCLEGSGPGGGDGDESGYAAFFTLWDWTDQIVDDDFDLTNPVPAGDMGHAWEPPRGLTEDVLAADAFVYLGIDGFQDEMLDVVEIAEEEGSDVVTIDASAGIDLHASDHDHGGESHDDESGDHDDHSEDDEGDGNDSHGEGDDHDDESGDHGEGEGHGDYDPHYWIDPQLAIRSVETIADGLVDADPDAEDTYRENAAAYVDRLESLHERFETELADRDHDVAVVAGHNSYQYLAERYDFEIHSPQGVQPDARPSENDVADTVDLIDEVGIDTVLYDHFESPGGDPPRLAATILEESAAEEAVAVTPVEGTTEAWKDDGWGYVEQMEEINLPAFKGALTTES